MGKAIVIDRKIKKVILDIGEQLLTPGEINLGWDDVKSVLVKGESSLVAVGHGTGRNRALAACDDALAICDDTSIKAVSGLLVHITGPENLFLWEVNEAVDMIKTALCSSDELTFGVARDNRLEDEIHIAILITQENERPL